MTQKTEDIVPIGTQVRSLSDKVHHLVGIGSVGTVNGYKDSTKLYTVLYKAPINIIVKSHTYRGEFDVIEEVD